jgi:hypothetical protein
MVPGAQRRQQWQRSLEAMLALGVAALVAQAIGQGAPASMASAAGDKPVVLQKFPARRYAFDLVIAPCRSEECPIQVLLRQQGKIVDRFTLNVSASTQRAEPETVDAVWGADAGLKSWATGVETRYVSTVGRTVTVAPGNTGLLVTQSFAFEHRKRAHVFLLPSDGTLAAAWMYQEGSGPTWSATQVVPGSTKGIQEIVVFRGFREPAEDLAERLEVVRLSAEASAAPMRETPLPDRTHPLYVVQVGSYLTTVEARQARLANGYCLGAYWVLDTERFHGVLGGKVALGNIYTRREAADADARSTRECLPSVTATVMRWTSGP